MELSNESRQKSEELLSFSKTIKEEQHLNNEIFKNVAEGIYLIGLDDLIIKWTNSRFEKMFGYDSGELIGKQVDVVNAPTNKTSTETRISIVNILKETGEWHGEVENIKKDGTHFWCYANVSLFKDPKYGEIIISVHTDITECKKAEEEKNKLQEQLLNAQKMESIGRLAGGIAHDFNNMLWMILGNTELSLETIDPSSQIYENLLEIKKATIKSATLTRQLLAFASKQAIKPVSLNLNNTISDLLNILNKLIGENIKLTWKPDQNIWNVLMDPSQVDQIITNLCINARDSITNIGEVVIITKNFNMSDIFCTSHERFTPGDYVLLTVSDNGCGIEKNIIDNIFDPFFTTKKCNNTGLGLATVYGIIKQNNGFIEVSSEQKKGTTFSIYLPANKNVINNKNIELQQKTISQNIKETILIVEDELALLNLAKSIIGKLGYNMLFSNSSNEAIKIAKELKKEIHLLLTDVILPEINGYELSKRILADHPEMKVLFMSGYTSDIIQKNGILEIETNFIQKPFTIKELEIKIRDTLDGKI